MTSEITGTIPVQTDVELDRLRNNTITVINRSTLQVRHQCGWGNDGVFVPARYNSSRAKCIRCSICNAYFSPNKFIFHCHPSPNSTYRHPAAANFNSWRRHLELVHTGNDDRLLHAWEDVKAMFNGGCRKRISGSSSVSLTSSSSSSTSSSFSSFGRGNASCLAPSRFDGAYGNISVHSQSGDVGGSQCHSNNHGSNEIQNLRKLATVPSMGTPQQKTLFPPGAGALNLMPPSVAANPHPAFFASGVQGHVMSYGDYLRSMSRPYNMGSQPVIGNNLVPNIYRAPPPSILPGMFGASSYPLNYFGYPSYFAGTAVPDNKGGNPALPFQLQLSAFRGFSTRTDSGRENYRGKHSHNEEEEETISRQEIRTTEETEDEISVDEGENRDEPVEDEVTDGRRMTEDVGPEKVPEDVQAGRDAGEITADDKKGQKEDVKVDEPSKDKNARHIDNDVDDEEENDERRFERRSAKDLDGVGHVAHNEVRFKFQCMICV